jgi:hypothetical protein
LLGRLWLHTVFWQADRVQAQWPGAVPYWFLICSGYKTWRYLPVFFRHYFPNPHAPTPLAIQQTLDALALRKFGRQYDPISGVVRLERASPLRSGVADITEQRLRDPMVAFFARMNPGHAQGDELACLAEISRSNLTRAGIRLLDAGFTEQVAV